MKIHCVKEKIKNAIYLAERITNKNLSLPILGSVLLSTELNNLKIRSTNLDLGIEVKIPSKIEKEGVIAVPGNILNNFLSNITDDNIIFETIDNNLYISTKNNSTVIKCYSPEDFPTLPLIQKGDSFFIQAEKLLNGFKSVWYSASISDIKPEISSVFVYPDKNTITFTATDSFRLAEKKLPLETKNEFGSLLIPYKNTIEITKVLEYMPKDTEIEVVFNKNQAVFKHNSFYVTSRVIDGVFPDYKQIVPKEFKTEVVVLKYDLINSLKITNLFSDKFNQVIFSINPAKKTFEVTSKNADIGENKTLLQTALSGEPVKIQFNQKYIMDCFQSIPGESVSLQLNGDGKPLVVKGIGDTSFLYLVMPLNQ